MLKNNHGHIVAISSCAGLFGLENLVPYCGTKFAVRGIMEATMKELLSQNPSTNIKFTVIYPYMVDTGLCKKPFMRFKSSMRMENPKTVARKIVEAQRRNVVELTIPKYYLYLNNVFR